MGKLSSPQAVLLGGLIAGTIDIGAAALINGRSPLLICRFIAGGLLGRGALDAGAWVVALGLGLQWAMSIAIAAIYVLAGERLQALRRNWALFGVLYGVPVYFVMEYVVVPLSAWRRFPTFEPLFFAENMAAMMLFGLIVAFFASRIRAG